jgi:hypothetical protein
MLDIEIKSLPPFMAAGFMLNGLLFRHPLLLLLK